MKFNKTAYITLATLGLALVAAFVYALFADDMPFMDSFSGQGNGRQATGELATQEKPLTPKKTLREIRQNAESKLDPQAVLEADIAAVKKKAAMMKEQEKTAQLFEPLTDIAPPPPQVDITAEEHPAERLKKMNLPPPPQYQLQSKLPKNTDTANPPRWNKIIAQPEPPLEAPDPFEPPPIKVNPARVPQQ